MCETSLPKTQTSRAAAQLRNGESGFSLIELLIALIMFVVVISSVWSVLHVARRMRGNTNRQVAINKSLRVAMQMIGRDTLNAGYNYAANGSNVLTPNARLAALLNVPADANATYDTASPIIAGDNRTLNALNPTPNTFTDQVTFVFEDPTFNVDANNVSQSLDAVVSGAQGVNILNGVNTVCRVNDLLLISNGTTSVLKVVTGLNNGNLGLQFNNGDPLNFNNSNNDANLWFPVSTEQPTRVSVKRVTMLTFRATADGILMRTIYGNDAAQPVRDEALIYDVENFQIEYVLDNGALTATPADMARVRQVRYNIGVRSADIDQTNNQPIRVSLNATFSTRNLGY